MTGIANPATGSPIFRLATLSGQGGSRGAAQRPGAISVTSLPARIRSPPRDRRRHIAGRPAWQHVGMSMPTVPSSDGRSMWTGLVRPCNGRRQGPVPDRPPRNTSPLRERPMALPSPGVAAMVRVSLGRDGQKARNGCASSCGQGLPANVTTWLFEWIWNWAWFARPQRPDDYEMAETPIHRCIIGPAPL